MKKNVFFFALGLLFAGASAFTIHSIDLKKSTAEVEQLQGLYIFTDSKPLMEYEYLGTVSNKGSLGLGDTQYSGVRDKLISRCKKDYPQADGIIFTFKSGGTDRADAIRFK